jgi:hypothetical protein
MHIRNWIHNWFKTRETSGASDPGNKKEEVVKNAADLDKINARLERLEVELEKAVSGYRVMLIKENPDILPEMVRGESIEALHQSLDAARKLTARIKEKLEAEAEAKRVPAGAPARQPPDTGGLSPYEKIRYGLEKEEKN